VVDRAALEEFPRQLARTRRFSLGIPRGFRVSPDGERVVFLRTRAGDDPVSCLWSFDLTSSTERCLVDPRELASLRDEPELTEAERARRERAREHAEGITAFEADDHLRRAVFVLSTRLYLADLIEGGARELPAAVPVDGPRIDPRGTKVAYVSNGALHVLEIDGADRVLAEDPSPDVTWGLPEFIAAEEMRRFQGSWWSPDGSRLAAARVDESRVRVWHIFDATDPASAPRAVRYPQAGTDDAEVTLHVFELATGERVEVSWDRTAFPYLARVCWSDGSPLTILVQTRDQRTTRLLEVDTATGSTWLGRRRCVWTVAGSSRWSPTGASIPTGSRSTSSRSRRPGCRSTRSSRRARACCSPRRRTRPRVTCGAGPTPASSGSAGSPECTAEPRAAAPPSLLRRRSRTSCRSFASSGEASASARSRASPSAR